MEHGVVLLHEQSVITASAINAPSRSVAAVSRHKITLKSQPSVPCRVLRAVSAEEPRSVSRWVRQLPFPLNIAPGVTCHTPPPPTRAVSGVAIKVSDRAAARVVAGGSAGAVSRYGARSHVSTRQSDGPPVFGVWTCRARGAAVVGRSGAGVVPWSGAGLHTPQSSSRHD